jgi:hypothetical protein
VLIWPHKSSIVRIGALGGGCTSAFGFGSALLLRRYFKSIVSLIFWLRTTGILASSHKHVIRLGNAKPFFFPPFCTFTQIISEMIRVGSTMIPSVLMQPSRWHSSKGRSEGCNLGHKLEKINVIQSLEILVIWTRSTLWGTPI